MSTNSAVGIPNRAFFGDLGKLSRGQMLDFLIQYHKANRAGPHFDVRFGDPSGLFSWATRNQLPTPGGKSLLIQQPMHSYKYKDYEGIIPQGYGAGIVKKVESGNILITHASPEEVHFTTAHKKYPERYVMILSDRPGHKGKKDWLLINTTPLKGPGYGKLRYGSVPQERVHEVLTALDRGESIEPKVDGASATIVLGDKGVEVFSQRLSKKDNRPIVHTERVFGDRQKIEVPKELRGTVLQGELYGERDGKVIPPQELGGILNATLANSLARKKQDAIKLRAMLHEVRQFGKEPVTWDRPRDDRRRMIEQALKVLPQDVFHMSEQVTDPRQAQQLWQEIVENRYPLTSEGIVYYPQVGQPQKIKAKEETDVFVRNVFPEEKHPELAGGFEYALEPNGPVVGSVGTGFSERTRRDLLADAESYKDRRARVKSFRNFPSGALRAPVFLAFHEDYPNVKSASCEASFDEMVELGLADEFVEKEASDYFYRALMSTPIRYDTGQTAIANVMNYLRNVRQRGRNMIQDAAAANQMELQLSPIQDRWQALRNYIRTGKTVPDLSGVDKVINHSFFDFI